MKVPGESSSRVEFNDHFLLFLNFILIISFYRASGLPSAYWRLLSVVSSSRWPRWHSLKHKNEKPRVDLSTFTFCGRVLNMGNGLPEEVVTVSKRKTFQKN